MTKQALIVCPPGGGSPLREVAGLTLIERLLRQLSAAGIDEVRVVAAPGFVVPPPVLAGVGAGADRRVGGD